MWDVWPFSARSQLVSGSYDFCCLGVTVAPDLTRPCFVIVYTFSTALFCLYCRKNTDMTTPTWAASVVYWWSH